MKKIILIVFAVFLFTNCQAPTSAIVIENKSNYPAALKIEHIKENKNNVILQPTEGITLSLIAPNTIKYAVSLESISRNYLKFISDNYCVIENTVPERYTIINTTRFKVILTEKNNLFDKTTIDGISGTEIIKSKNLDVFSSFLNIQAITDDEFKIILDASVQNKKIIIKL
ncbi:hypothetical protein [Treponema denticola]|uniref:hypothetical protein n=1 Tax=Treponema denticola TaxID=158 RepID=UPI0002B5F77A|nr:hypothetical protein [Treponema denticola]EMB47049.1 hypothetical protein HMPREF9730_00067 [Treponema denticola AL-2]